jgi:putative transposase
MVPSAWRSIIRQVSPWCVTCNGAARRLMRENDLQPKRRKRFVATTDSNHDGPIFPDLARHKILDGPNQVWVADITYIAIAAGFVYMAAILDAWSRRVVGYAISRSIDARLAVAALKAAIRARQPPKGCIHHSDRGSQYASEVYRGLLTDHGLVGSMGRRGNPYAWRMFPSVKAPTNVLGMMFIKNGIKPTSWVSLT